jgi:hypothetical protein
MVDGKFKIAARFRTGDSLNHNTLLENQRYHFFANGASRKSYYCRLSTKRLFAFGLSSEDDDVDGLSMVLDTFFDSFSIRKQCGATACLTTEIVNNSSLTEW